MTVQEVRDAFVMSYEVECKKRGINQIEDLSDKWVALKMSEGEMEAVRRIGILESSQDITIVATQKNYNLNSNFGRPIKLEDNTYIYTEIPYNEYLNLHTSDSNYYFAVQYADTNVLWLNPEPTTSTVDPTMTYGIDTNYYSSAATDWRSVSTNVFDGDLMIPRRYHMAIVQFVMKEMFPDLEGRYERTIQSLRESQPFSQTLDYRMNGGIGY